MPEIFENGPKSDRADAGRKHSSSDGEKVSSTSIPLWCKYFLNREEEEAEKFLGKIEDVNKMLGQLMSKDDKEVGPTW